MNKLSEFQMKLKAPKGQHNNFGNYNYRSCEDILEALKPIINPDGFSINLSDEILLIGERYYVKATATLTNGEISFISTASAREEDNKKGMDASQITGAASSYARKYALNGLFAIDDTRDSDATNQHEDKEPARRVSPETLAPNQDKRHSDDARPWLTEKQLKEAVTRMEDGDGEVFKQVVEKYRMKREYRKMLEETNEHWKSMYAPQEIPLERV